VRLENAVHEAHPWVMARIAPDFELLDVWELPAEGRADEFEELVETVMSLDPTRSRSTATRALFALRFKLGELFGWDDAEQALPVPGSEETSLSARVPRELRDETTAPVSVGSTTFMPIYRTDDEVAAEISNSTVHGVMQLTWVERANDVYGGRMGIYVKPRGRLGPLYMAAIAPFRHLIVYPAMMREVERAWTAKRAFRDR
jgi:Protein of unknown function (DUF2867)